LVVYVVHPLWRPAWERIWNLRSGRRHRRCRRSTRKLPRAPRRCRSCRRGSSCCSRDTVWRTSPGTPPVSIRASRRGSSTVSHTSDPTAARDVPGDTSGEWFFAATAGRARIRWRNAVGEPRMAESDRFTLTLESVRTGDSRPSAIRLRALLKLALRSFGFRCVCLRPGMIPESVGNLETDCSGAVGDKNDALRLRRTNANGAGRPVRPAEIAARQRGQ